MSNVTIAINQGGTEINGRQGEMKLYYNKHRETILKYQKDYHEKNHVTYLQNQKNYYQRTKANKMKLSQTKVHCDCCKKDLNKGSIWDHNKTKIHLKNKLIYLLTNSTYETVEGEIIVYKPIVFGKKR
jgi:hypothetical protein